MGNLAIKGPNLEAQNVHQLQTKQEPTRNPLSEVKELDLVGSHYDSTYGVEWLYLKPDSPTKFTPDLINELRDKQTRIHREISTDIESGKKPRINYHVFSSKIPGVFNLGGDLQYFKNKIQTGDREGLRIYARKCVDLVFTSASNFQLPVTTIALIQGSAMGGGFEAALANNHIIAEEQSTMGLPEILFNLFPGMGAYQLLRRRLPPHQAEKLILSGRTYRAEELKEMGVIDSVVEQGKGEEAVWDYIRQVHGKMQGRHGLRQAVQAIDPLDHNDFVNFVDVWVDKVFQLRKEDLRTMDMLVRAQLRAGHK